MPENVARNLSKIRDKDGAVELRWWIPNGADRESGKFGCNDKPTEEFVDAMQALAEVGASRLQPVIVPPECFTVTTVSFSEDKGGKLAVIISGSCRVESGGFGLNTPRLHQPSTDGGEVGPGTLTVDQWAKVAECARQAHLYLGGDRVNRTLGLEDGGAEEEQVDDPQVRVV